MSEFFEYPVGGEIDHMVGIALSDETYETEPRIDFDEPLGPNTLQNLLDQWEGRAEVRAFLCNGMDYSDLRCGCEDLLDIETRGRYVAQGVVARLGPVGVVKTPRVDRGHLWIVGCDDDGWVKREIVVQRRAYA